MAIARVTSFAGVAQPAERPGRFPPGDAGAIPAPRSIALRAATPRPTLEPLVLALIGLAGGLALALIALAAYAFHLLAAGVLW